MTTAEYNAKRAKAMRELHSMWCDLVIEKRERRRRAQGNRTTYNASNNFNVNFNCPQQ